MPERLKADKVLAAIPGPEVVRGWLAKAIQDAQLLRSLLRVAERKARSQQQEGGGGGT
jgi:hypothetical protein